MAYLARLVTGWVPQRAIRALSTRFVAITHVGDRITCSGTVVEKLPGRQVRLALTAQDQSGIVKLAGEAIVELRMTPAWMTEDVVLFRDNVRKVFEREFAPLEERWRRQHLADRSVWRQAGEMGLLCTSIPEAYGGGAARFAHEAVVAYEQGRALVNSFSINVHSGIVAHYLLAYGSEAQKQRWLPKMATGELVAAIAMSEPGAGSDLQARAHAARGATATTT